LADLVAPAAQGSHGDSGGVGDGGVIDATPVSPASDGDSVSAQVTFAFAAPTLERGSAFQVAGRAAFVAVLRGFPQQAGVPSSATFGWSGWLVDIGIGG
jgi:predicted acylesterase/phospholipase RssA